MGRDRFENLNQLPYLDMVLKESLRIFPSVPSIGRVLTEDVTLRGYKIPKGCNVGVSIVGLHRNPRVFPDPLKFDPERWSVRAWLRGDGYRGWRRCSGGRCTMGGLGRARKDGEELQHPYAYVPFSAGPRNCIGQRFAQVRACNTTKKGVLR